MLALEMEMIKEHVESTKEDIHACVKQEYMQVLHLGWRDIIENLISKRVYNLTDFHWLMNLRYYWLDFNAQIFMYDLKVQY